MLSICPENDDDAITIANIVILELTRTTLSLAPVASNLPSGLKHTLQMFPLIVLWTRPLCNNDDVRARGPSTKKGPNQILAPVFVS